MNVMLPVCVQCTDQLYGNKIKSDYIPYISSQIQQLAYIGADGGVFTRAVWKSINTCKKIKPSEMPLKSKAKYSTWLCFLSNYYITVSQ